MALANDERMFVRKLKDSAAGQNLLRRIEAEAEAAADEHRAKLRSELDEHDAKAETTRAEHGAAVVKAERALASIREKFEAARDARDQAVTRQNEWRFDENWERGRLLAELERAAAPELIEFLRELPRFEDLARARFGTAIITGSRYTEQQGRSLDMVSNGDDIACFLARCRSGRERVRAAIVSGIASVEARSLVAQLWAQIKDGGASVMEDDVHAAV